MRKLWVACCLVLFTLGTLAGCEESAAPPQTAKDKPAASAADATKPAASTDKKKSSKPAPGKSAKPHSTSGK
jgi:hypothetical protein